MMNYTLSRRTIRPREGTRVENVEFFESVVRGCSEWDVKSWDENASVIAFRNISSHWSSAFEGVGQCMSWGEDVQSMVQLNFHAGVIYKCMMLLGVEVGDAFSRFLLLMMEIRDVSLAVPLGSTDSVLRDLRSHVGAILQGRKLVNDAWDRLDIDWLFLFLVFVQLEEMNATG